ncbi:transcriptional regulator [Nitratireductor indicus C115]|uniref:Transcriptional regulator n=2 Tax=Nitratireductor indicus TaxID=721133 RepID=K2NVB6_9HYPH|nr:transcriptional regulator [Nitratireductor indicus C115]
MAFHKNLSRRASLKPEAAGVILDHTGFQFERNFTDSWHLFCEETNMGSASLISGDHGSAAHERLRMWIRLMRASRLIEAVLRERLKTRFDTTLPRFEVLAALARTSDGMTMSDISRALLVSNGNITGIVERLVGEGLADRTRREGDRRTSVIRLTETGQSLVARMVEAHRNWIDELLGDLPDEDVRGLVSTLNAFENSWEGHA